MARRGTIKEYARKRDFTKTPEPAPTPAGKSASKSSSKLASKSASNPASRAKSKRSGKALAFVVQKHDASHLHYDFRLELEGVLKSWAVPKGPSLDPKDKRLAVEVEDHPLPYGNFEGTIPQGEYGGGAVMLWDRGVWTPLETDASAALRKGKLSFTLQGEKLSGEWTLTRMPPRRAGDKPNWLLIKKTDDAAAPGTSIIDQQPRSVKTGRDLDEIAAGGRSRPPPGRSTNRSGKRSPTGSNPASRSRAKPAPRTTLNTNARTRTSARAASRRSPAPPAAVPALLRTSLRSSSKPSRASSPASRHRPGASTPSVDPALLRAITGARLGMMERNLDPQLCALVGRAPVGDEWIHEVKFDGYRLLCYIENRAVKLMTRGGKDWTSRFDRVAQDLAGLGAQSAIIDGEVCFIDPRGKSSFQGLQNAIKDGGSQSLILYAFDVLYLDGVDLRRAALLDRKNVLRGLIENRPGLQHLRYSDHIAGSGEEIHARACGMSMEGIVSKLADAPYQPGRSRTWLKVKCGQRQEFIIAGYTAPGGSRTHFGALLLAAHDAQGRLIYTGQVGTGFSQATLRDVMRRLTPLKRDAHPLDVDPPRAEVRDATWVEPKLVCEVAFSEWTHDLRLRHPSFQGLREDKPAADVRIEQPAPQTDKTAKARSIPMEEIDMPDPTHTHVHSSSRRRKSAGTPTRSTGEHAKQAGKSANAAAPPTSAKSENTVHGVRVTHPERVVFPERGITKLQLVQYYDLVAERMLPYIADRPLSTVRCPEGSGGSCFFQKHIAQTFRPPVKSIEIEESDGPARHITIDSVEGLLMLIQNGVIEIHPWGSRNDDVERPDMLTIDLDPGPDISFDEVKVGAIKVRTLLNSLDLTCFVKTSGGKGLHIAIPIDRTVDWETAKSFARGIAEQLERREPTAYVSVMNKAKRKGRIFVDYLRNGRGATSVAAYSARARPRAGVSMPLDWNDLVTLKAADTYTVPDLLAGNVKLGKDPWRAFFKTRQRLTAARLRAVAQA
ncbi:MAG TPA: DNA ligase D [Phycisphaerales bacterium]|nr:DNA ligase D [Phycisphaerales bacterium]